ncbi:aryl-alcohol dehydrogenase-like predicted oxidoreductase [Micromonospora pisi]|uniref:Aryl-alcohol dehydrogenase-like predicted oxidoreductase n=1 Tax=Micromonospora pisi TaxID=589240 RepID=A0A495JJ07_9ACTN|nr:aldo/keto reductase [Micromonospora pisi]RKR88923.1 aryl-alcohol dehydrogenase-like predicted oxidoreductase [Micromonospora pisi]
MKYRLLGRTGVWVSEISLGAMTFGGKDHPIYRTLGGLQLDEVDRMVGTALDAGINFIDTADIYSDGESEELLGQALKQRRRDVVLATKLHAPTGPGPNDNGLSRLHVMQALEDSLRRLDTDHIDLYQVHNFDHITPIEETLAALDDAVRQGKVRYIGCANLAAWQISRALGVSALHNQSAFVSVQAYYSLVGRDAERDLLPMAQAEGLGMTVWSPLAGGFLAGKVDRTGAVTDGGSRRNQDGYAQFPPIDQERGHDVVDVVRTVAVRHGVSPAQVSLAWLLAQRGVTSVIAGARRLDQLADNIAASDLTLTDQDLTELDQVSALPPAYPNWIQAAFAPARTPR